MSSVEQSLEFRVSKALKAKLLEYSIVKTYQAGDVILSENAHIRSIPIVNRGTIRVMRTEKDGRELLLYYIKAGESCIMSFLGGIHNEKSKLKAEVEEEAEILFLPVEKIPELMRDYPEWLNYIFKLYHKRFEELLEVIHAVAFKKVDERLLLLLNKKAELLQSKTIAVTHEQLANELGTARVVVSRLLKQLEINGEVKLGRNQVTLLP
ncbi:MAG: Crp/Fnr family transcriptional regulator [Chlorobiales bacterium]